MRKKIICLLLTVLAVFSMIGIFAHFAPCISAAAEAPAGGTITMIDLYIIAPHDGMSVTVGNVKSNTKVNEQFSKITVGDSKMDFSDVFTLSSATLTSPSLGVKVSGRISSTQTYNYEIKFKIKDGFTVSDTCKYSGWLEGYENKGKHVDFPPPSGVRYTFSASVSGQTLTLQFKRVSLYFKTEIGTFNYCGTHIYRIGYGVPLQYDVPLENDTYKQYKSLEILEWRDHTTGEKISAFTNESGGSYDAVVRLTLKEWVCFPKDADVSFFARIFSVGMNTDEYIFRDKQYKRNFYDPYKILELTDDSVTMVVELPAIGKDKCHEIICKNCTAYFNGVPVRYMAEPNADVTIVCDPPAEGETIVGYLNDGSHIQKMDQTFSFLLDRDVTIEIEYKKLIREVHIDNFIPAYIGEHPVYGNLHATADRFQTPTDEELRDAASQTVKMIVEALKASDPSKVPTEEEIRKFYEVYYEEIKDAWRKWEHTGVVLGMHYEVGEDDTFSDTDYRFCILFDYNTDEYAFGKETKIYINGELWSGEFTYSNSKLILLMHAQEKKTVNVSFAANGGSGTMKAESLPALYPFELPACSFKAPSGKTFDGWKIGTKAYKVGDVVYPEGNTTVTAVWAQSHTHKGELVPMVSPTCTKEGVIAYYKCSCGKIFTDSGCKYEITDKNTMGLPMTSHMVSDWITDKEAKPGVKGSKHKECIVCHAVIETETIPALAEECRHTNTKLVNALGATCLTEGYTGDTVCNVCGTTVSFGKKISALGHDYGDDGICKRCGQKDPAASGAPKTSPETTPGATPGTNPEATTGTTSETTPVTTPETTSGTNPETPAETGDVVATSGIVTTDEPDAAPVEPDAHEKTSLWWLWVLIAIVVTGGAVGGVIACNKKKEK